MVRFIDTIVGVFRPPPVIPVQRAMLYRVVDGIYAIRVPIPQVWIERTTMEKVLLAAGVTWCAWKFLDLQLYRRLSPVLNGVMPGYRWLISKLKDPVILHKVEQTGMFHLESTREGSIENAMTVPPCQCNIAIKSELENELIIVGCATRFPNNCLVAPDHVLVDNAPKYAIGRQGRLSLLGKVREALDADLVYIQLEERDFATIGVSAAKISSLVPTGVVASVVGSKDVGTVGLLHHDHLIFGRVCYDGTTLGGYSGAAYTAGNEVLGVHQHGGRVNGGYSSSYIWTMIRNRLKIRFEDSDTWLLGQYKAGRKIKYKLWGVDEVVIEIGGTYSTVQKGSLVTAFGDTWDAVDGIIHIQNRRDYDDAVPESTGEANNLKHPGALSSSEKSQASSVSQHQQLIDAYANLPKKSQRNFRKFYDNYNAQQIITHGQEVKNTQPTN